MVDGAKSAVFNTPYNAVVGTLIPIKFADPDDVRALMGIVPGA
jgi:hypothetical protein